MEWTPRTVLRVFLILAGLYVLGIGILEESVLRSALGVFAIALGGFGLWWEAREPGNGSRF